MLATNATIHITNRTIASVGDHTSMAPLHAILNSSIIPKDSVGPYYYLLMNLYDI